MYPSPFPSYSTWAALWEGPPGTISDGFKGSARLGSVTATGSFDAPTHDIAGTAKFPLAVNTSDQCLEEVDSDYTPASWLVGLKVKPPRIW